MVRYGGGLMSSWPELRYMQVQVNSLSDDAESLKLITFGLFLFWVAENRNSAPAEKSPEVHSGDGCRPGMQI